MNKHIHMYKHKIFMHYVSQSYYMQVRYSSSEYQANRLLTSLSRHTCHVIHNFNSHISQLVWFVMHEMIHQAHTHAKALNVGPRELDLGDFDAPTAASFVIISMGDCLVPERHVANAELKDAHLLGSTSPSYPQCTLIQVFVYQGVSERWCLVWSI